MKYPGTFPLPTDTYGESITPFANQTPMESGWVRQRKRWDQEYTTIPLVFELDTVSFHSWNDWAQNSGYDWFTMPLDIVSGVRFEKDIRFTTPLSYRYTNWNTVIVTVTAEVSNVKENPTPIPQLVIGEGPNWKDQCTYECDAFDTQIAIASPSASAAGNDCDVFWEGSKETFPWPFATSTAERATKMRMEGNIISAPVVIPEWPTTGQTGRGISISSLSSWVDWTPAEQLGFCGIPVYVGSIRGPESGVNAIIPSGDSLGTNGSDYSATIIFTGFNGADAGTFPLLRNMNRKVASAESGTLGSASMFISVGGSAGARTLNISIGNDEGNSAVSYPIGTVGEGRWFMLRVHVESVFDQVPSDDGDLGDDALITASVRGSITPSDGAAIRIEATGTRRWDNGNSSHTGLFWSSNFGAAGGIFYDRPQFFSMSSSSGQCSFAYAGYDTDPALDIAGLSALENSFKKTFVDYEGPC